MSKFSKHKWWIVTALITVPLVAIAAVPNIFTPNTVISSAQVNANFAMLDSRIAALEAANAKTSATIIMNNVAGPIVTTASPVKTVTYMATGVNPLLLIISGTAWSPSNGNLDVAIQFDGVVIGHLTATSNELSSHKSLPTHAFPIATPAAGSHTIGLLYGNATTITDGSDYFSITVVELH